MSFEHGSPDHRAAAPRQTTAGGWLAKMADTLLAAEDAVWRFAGSAHLKHADLGEGSVSSLMLFRSILLMTIASIAADIGFLFAGTGLVTPETRQFALIGCYAFNVVEFAALAMILKGNRRGAGRLMMCATWITVVSVILLTGGVFHSVALPMLMVIPCICYCLGNVRAGLAAAASAPPVIFALQSGLGLANIAIPDFTSQTSDGFNAVMLIGSTYLVVVLCMGGLVRSNMDLHRKLRAEHAKMENLASIDALTGIANRRAFDAALSNQLAPGHADTGAVGLILMDLNGFKPINDRYGHPVGDEVLKLIAQRLASDPARLPLVARLGGDEFAVIARNGLDRRGLEQLAQDIKKLISMPMDVGEHRLTVGGSFGVAISTEDGTTVEGLMRAADDGLYHDKRGTLVSGPWKTMERWNAVGVTGHKDDVQAVA